MSLRSNIYTTTIQGQENKIVEAFHVKTLLKILLNEVNVRGIIPSNDMLSVVHAEKTCVTLRKCLNKHCVIVFPVDETDCRYHFIVFLKPGMKCLFEIETIKGMI